MRRDFLKSAAAAGIGLAGASALAQQAAAPAAAGAAGTGLRGNPSDVYVMNVMVSGVEYWFPVYEMMKQLGRTLGVKTRYTGTPSTT
jgi:ribose transport system substrate-binding protein